MKADNISNEIPLVNRRIVELDIEGSTRSLNLPKDLLVYVASLNMIKSIIEDDKLFSFNDFLQKHTQQNGLNILVECAAQTMNLLTAEKRNRLKQFFLNLLLTSDDLKHLDTEILRKANLFSSEEILDIKRQRNGNDLPMPYIATLTDWKMCEAKSTNFRFPVHRTKTLDVIYRLRYTLRFWFNETTTNIVHECNWCPKIVGKISRK